MTVIYLLVSGRFRPFSIALPYCELSSLVMTAAYIEIRNAAKYESQFHKRFVHYSARAVMFVDYK